jgi:FtsX-like permease family
MTAVWLFLRAEARLRWRAWLSLALIVGLFTGGVVTAAAGALRTGSAYARFLDWSRVPDALVAAEPYSPIFARLSPAAVMRIPQAENAAVIKTILTSPAISLQIPASSAVPGQFWKRKILSGRLADPGRPNEVNVSFPLAQRLHLRAGDRLPLVLSTAAGRPVPFVFHVAGIDAAQTEFPPQPGNGTYTVWGTPAFYRQHRELDGFTQIALRFHHGGRDWPAVRQELRRHTHGMPVQAMLLSSQSTQSVNTQRSIHPQAVALWLLAALFGAIGLLIVGQLLARLSFLEATGYGTLRALGMSRGQLMTGCLGRAAAIGAAGGVIGAVLGVALSPLLPLGLARVAEPQPGIDADVPVLAAGLAAAVLVTACCAAWPGWRATAERPLPGPGQDRHGVVSRLAATGPVPVAMGTRLALHRGAGRTAVPVRSAVASAAVGVAALSAAIVFAGSLSHLLASPVLYGVTWDAVVGNDADTDMRPVVAAVRHDRQVAAWTAGWAGLPLRAGRTEFDAIVLSVPGGASFVPPPVTGRLPRTSREIALGMRTLRELRARIGTTIQVSAPLLNIPGHPMTIVGTTVFPTMSDALDLGTGAALSPGGLQYLLPGKAPIPPPGVVFVRFRPGVEPQAGRQDLAARLAEVGSFTVDGPATPTDLLNFGQVRDLPQVLGIGLAAVALLTIAHLLITSVRRRRRDFAIMRAFGFTSRQIRGTLCWQALTLAGIALVIGVPAGIACGRFGWQIFANQLGITPVTAVPVAVLSVMAAGWLAAAVVIAVLPGEAATRTPPARALRSE